MLFLKYVVYLLAVYGALSIIFSILGTIRFRTGVNGVKVRIVLIVKDVENCIEYIVRNAIKGDFASKVMSGGNLTIINMGSSDGTAGILDKLHEDYECIDLLDADDKEKIFSDFE